MDALNPKEAKIIQTGASGVGDIVAETARACGWMNATSKGELNRAAGVRAGCTVMLPGVLGIASLIGLNKKGKLCCSSADDPTDFCNEAAILFATILMANMSGEIVNRSKSEVLLSVEFGPTILAKTLESVEKIYGPVDGKIDNLLIETARETIDTGNKALEMLDRLVTAGRAN